LETKIFEGSFRPLRLFLIAAAMVFGTPFLAGYFLGRYVEMKKLKKL
jgi:hypothetical protein